MRWRHFDRCNMRGTNLKIVYRLLTEVFGYSKIVPADMAR
jgi:hypothetical protein